MANPLPAVRVIRHKNEFRGQDEPTDRSPKVVQGKIDSQPREKALQAAAKEKVTFGQLCIRQGSISEATSEAIDLSAFKAKEDITTALSLLEEAKGAVDQLEPSSEARLISRHLRRASRTLNSSWDHTQVASLTNTGVSFAGMATVDVGLGQSIVDSVPLGHKP